MTVVTAQGRPTHGQPLGTQEMQLDDADGLVQLSHLVQGAFTRIADRHHLTPVQARLLCMLAQDREQFRSAMGKITQCAGQTAGWRAC